MCSRFCYNSKLWTLVHNSYFVSDKKLAYWKFDHFVSEYLNLPVFSVSCMWNGLITLLNHNVPLWLGVYNYQPIDVELICTEVNLYSASLYVWTCEELFTIDVLSEHVILDSNHIYLFLYFAVWRHGGRSRGRFTFTHKRYTLMVTS